MQIKRVVAASFTRPNDTTAYASGDLVANSTTNTEVTPMTFNVGAGVAFKIWRAELLRSDTDVANASFRLHLYNDLPTVSNGDNSAWLSIEAGYQGFIDIVGTSPAFSDDAKAHGVYVNNSVFAPMLIAMDGDAKIYGLLEARGAYQGAALESFTVSLVGEIYN